MDTPSLYLPAHFAAPLAEQQAFMRAYPFVLLVAVEAGLPLINHVPVLLAADATSLRFHLARANPLTDALTRVAAASVVFHGPHAYVSPRWYAQPNVPTWNYAAVHASGPVRTLDAASTAQLVADLSRVYEGPAGLGEFEQAPAYRQLLGGITGFELTVAACVGKFKLSQNRTPEDRASVIAELAQDARSEVRETAAMMRALDGL